MTLKLYIGNKNYSSWSMRAGVLLRAFGIAHDEILIRIDGFDANSTFKTEVNRIGATGTVPFLIDTSVQDGHDQSLIITDTLSIVEYIAETFADHAIWPKDRAMRAKARNLCAEMHSGFGALRQHCMMNIGPDLSRAGALIWRDHAAVRRDVARIETAWADMLALSGGPYLAGGFSALDAYFAPVVIRLKYYSLPVTGESQTYMNRIFKHPAIEDWVGGAVTSAEFLDFEEPFRLSTDDPEPV